MKPAAIVIDKVKWDQVKVRIEYVDSETITSDTVTQLAQFDAVLVPGGFGVRGSAALIWWITITV